MCGIAAPSANRFGRISPTEAAHVRDELGDAVP
jgi:L-threonylcarbamoyladenylate synthase